MTLKIQTKAIITALEQGPGTVTDIQKRLKYHCYQTLASRLTRMTEQGIIKKIGLECRSFLYALKDFGRYSHKVVKLKTNSSLDKTVKPMTRSNKIIKSRASSRSDEAIFDLTESSMVVNTIPIILTNNKKIVTLPLKPNRPIASDQLLPESFKCDRHVYCKNYDDCLDIAIKKDWRGFSCELCSNYDPVMSTLATRRPNARYE